MVEKSFVENEANRQYLGRMEDLVLRERFIPINTGEWSTISLGSRGNRDATGREGNWSVTTGDAYTDRMKDLVLRIGGNPDEDLKIKQIKGGGVRIDIKTATLEQIRNDIRERRPQEPDGR